MKPQEFVELLGKEKASAILRCPEAAQAAPAMNAAIRGGFKIVEFTLTIPGVWERLEEFSQRGDCIVGAGTVLTVDEARRAVASGASFLVSPVVDEEVIEAAHELGVAVMPGTHTPTEMHRAHKAGAQLQKVFPAPGIGPDYIKACLGPLPFLKLVPTNGVWSGNIPQYMQAGAYAMGFVGSLFDAALVAGTDWSAIEARAKNILGIISRQ